MVKKILLPAMAGLTIAMAPAALVGATDENHRPLEGFRLRGEGTCQVDGSFKIVWSVKNREDEKMKIVFSSDESVVPKGTVVPKQDHADFTQVVSGTTAANYSLVLKARFPENTGGEGKYKEVIEHHDTVKLETPCTQPTGGRGGGETPPPTGGSGGGIAATSTQVQTTPSGAVNAGLGGVSTTSFGALTGLLASVASVGYGARRLVKSER